MRISKKQKITEQLNTLLESKDVDTCADSIMDIFKPNATRSRRANNTGSVYRLSGKRAAPWVAAFPGQPRYVVTSLGQQVRETPQIVIGYYKTKTEAEKALAMHFIAPVSEKHRITLKELFDEWKVLHYARVKSQAQQLYDGVFAYLEPLHNHVFKEIRTAQWQGVIDGMGKSRSYKDALRALLNLLYKYAMENDICHKNYAKFTRLPKAEKKDIVIFTDTEIKKLFDNDKVKGVDMILMLIYSGFRAQEFLNLTIFDVDLKAGLITGGLKTDNGINRVVPIHPKTRKYWEKYVAAAQDRLFTIDGRPLLYGFFTKKIYYPALATVGISRKTSHKCRDTFASMLAKEGASTLAIQQMMGHHDYAFTANHYTAKDHNFLIENIKKMK